MKKQIVTCDMKGCDGVADDEPSQLVNWVRVQLVATDPTYRDKGDEKYVCPNPDHGPLTFDRVLINSGADPKRLERGRK